MALFILLTYVMSEGDRPCWNLVWKAKIPPNMRSFAWKVLVGALPTGACMQWRHVTTSKGCRLCGASRDDTFHALVLCPRSLELWEVMRQVWPLPPNGKLLHTGDDWLFNILSAEKEDVRAMIIMLLWRIWSLRNDVLHTNRCLL